MVRSRRSCLSTGRDNGVAQCNALPDDSISRKTKFEDVASQTLIVAPPNMVAILVSPQLCILCLPFYIAFLWGVRGFVDLLSLLLIADKRTTKELCEILSPLYRVTTLLEIQLFGLSSLSRV